MTAEQPSSERRTSLPLASANISMKVGEYSVRFKFEYPLGPATTGDFLPAFRSLADLIVRLSAQTVEGMGKTISCQKGCGACCRQVVPVSPSEARDLARYVEELPEPKRSEIRSRFAEAVRRLEEAGLGEQLRKLAQSSEEEFRPFAAKYFAQKVACPFLEEESCSIHPARPIACREFLVTTPAELCSLPTPDEVKTVPLPASTGNAVRKLEGGWMPLALALEYATANPEGPPTGTGESVLRDFLNVLQRS
jgi:Fe-S-cluster containining protein